MKLVEILARGLWEWPDYAKYAEQDRDREVRFVGGNSRSDFFATNLADEDVSYSLSDGIPHSGPVTSEMWQAERDRIAKEQTTVKPKANKEGWIRHRGGKCPVDKGVLVDVRYRDGSTRSKIPALVKFSAGEWCADTEYWRHEDLEGDIMAWRPHVADHIAPMTEEGIKAADEGKTMPIGEVKEKWQGRLDAVMPAAKYLDGPLQWRDRILTIDTELKAEEARHCAAMEALDTERAELVGKLKAEGLAPCERYTEPVTVEPECDMSNPDNWRAGDVVECLDNHRNQFTRGGHYRLMVDSKEGRVKLKEDDQGEENGWNAKNFKWHSRPTQ